MLSSIAHQLQHKGRSSCSVNFCVLGIFIGVGQCLGGVDRKVDGMEEAHVLAHFSKEQESKKLKWYNQI